MLDNHTIVRYNKLSVFHIPGLNGGGTTHGQQFVPVVRNLFGKASNVFEFCAGPGYIGFSLLSERLCDTLCLSDVNPQAIEAINKTIETNDLRHVVSCHHTDGLSGIPANLKFDLVIANPPHFAGGVPRGIIANDVDWRIHERFYAGIGQYLSPDGSILVQENYHGSSERDFVPMIENAGLFIFRSFMWCLTMPHVANPYYFLWIKRKDCLLTEISPISDERVSVSLKSCDPIQLKENTRYCFELLDERDRNVGLKSSNGVTFFQLKPFVSIRERRGVSCPLLLTRGEFLLYDLETSETLSTLVVNATGNASAGGGAARAR